MSLSKWCPFICVSVLLSLFVLFLSVSPIYVSICICLILCLSVSLSLSVSVSFISVCHSGTPNSIGLDWPGICCPFPQALPSALSKQNLLLSVQLRNVRSGAAGAPEMLQNCLPSVEAESGNNEKLSNSQLLPPALLRLHRLQFRCKFPHSL